MVVDKVNGSPKRTTSPVRSSTRIRAARYQPTARETPVVTKPPPQRNLSQTSSTIYKLNIPGQTHVQHTIGTSQSRPCPPHLLQGLKNLQYRDGMRHHMASLTKHNMSSLRLQRNEKSVLDKVEDMDVDNQSDQEGAGEESVAETSSSSGSNTSTLIRGKSLRNIKRNNNCIVGGNELKKNSSNDGTQPGVKMKKKMHENVVKRKPIYIILHASVLRVGSLEGRALKPVRIQAGRILIEMELQSNGKQEMPVEPLTLRIPCKELLAIKVNLLEPPFIFVAVINEKYSKILIESSKNGMLGKLKEKLQVIVHLMYDIIPGDVSKDFNSFRSELETDIIWEEISSEKARRILSGEESCMDDIISTRDTKKVCLVEDKKKVIKENRKRQINSGSESKKNHKKIRGKKSSDFVISYTCLERFAPRHEHCILKKNDTSERSAVDVKKEDSLLSQNELDKQEESQRPSSPLVKRRRTLSYDESIPTSSGSQGDERTGASEEKVTSKNEVRSPKHHHSEVVSTAGLDKARTANSFRFPPSSERSFEENRLDATRVFELEISIAEKERMLSQQKRTVELRDLQLQQERDAVRELRASLREEQRTKRDLQDRYEAINSELLVRNTREAIADSHMTELERELSELNLTLSSTRCENERLGQEIHQVRGQLAEKEELLRTERERIATLQHEIETNRTTLETLREELRQKDLALTEERELRTAATERNTELEQQLIETGNDYEERLARSNAEHHRTWQEHEECNRRLVSTRDQLQDANRALHRAQETVDEYSRMQPRDWTISRDEIVITEKVLGQGAWGWVKEGKFRGTVVAVKQMHELIVSPHNRRLFEREMQIAARCRHPNLLQFIGATNDNGLALLVTELLDTDLRAVLGQRSLCHDEVVTIATDVSQALNYLHLNKPFPIIHRDISSTNVLLWKREDAYHAKLSDYGAANFMRQCMTVSPGACIYAAPEAVTSRQSTKVDVYSFGLLLCEMCIRELPVPGHTREQIRSITNAYLRELVQRSTNETPDDRPTMADVLTTLLRLSPNSALGIVSINNRHAIV